MKHPFELCATRYLCFCFYFEPDITCFILAVMSILFNAFGGVTNYGIWHWALYLVSLLLFAVHLFAGLLLLLGAYWGDSRLKLAYCWISFFCMFIVVIAFVLFVVLYKTGFIIWGSKCHDFNDVIGIVVVAMNSVWLILFDFYSTIVVLGNAFICEECMEGNPSAFYA